MGNLLQCVRHSIPLIELVELFSRADEPEQTRKIIQLLLIKKQLDRPTRGALIELCKARFTAVEAPTMQHDRDK